MEVEGSLFWDDSIQKTVTDDLNTLTENDFQYCYDQWKNVGTIV
jgi:hypothetical protein